MDSPDIEAVVQDLFRRIPGNELDRPEGVPLFDLPLVGVAAAGDAWFERLRTEVIGLFHFSPAEALACVAPAASARSVVSFFLPVNQHARRENAAETDAAARSWAYVRTFGERLNDAMRKALAGWFRERGNAAAPALLPENDVARRDGIGWSSRWSERHVAFIAGLGTFGISAGLITRRGIAGRFGSVVTDLPLEPTQRAYGDDPFAWCLHMARGTCGVCRMRCPAEGAIGEKASDRNKDRCRAHIGVRSRELKGTRYTWDGVYGCGLCQTGVPCESSNPVF